MQAVRHLTPVFAILLLIAGCATPPPKPPEQPREDPELQLAVTAMQAGDYATAAARYLALAGRTQGEEKGMYLLQAAEAYRHLQDREALMGVLAGLDNVPLAGDARLHRDLLVAEAALLGQEAEIALTILGDAPPTGISRPRLLRYLTNKAEAYRMLGNPLAAATLLDRRDLLLEGAAERLQNQVDLLQVLGGLSSQALNELRPSPPGTLGGWMALADTLKRNGHSPAILDEALAGWRAAFPLHPVLPEVLDQYRAKAEELAQPADVIAVLLPQGGPLARVANAVRDGFLAARYSLPEARRPRVRFYDTTDADAAWPVYTQAVADGAQLVVGPLQKQAVLQLARAEELPVPVLALNQVVTDSRLPEQLYMYALAPDDEARQAAEKAWHDGARQPILITPQNAWGERMANAFDTRWTELGGQVAGRHGYAADTHDYSAAITSLLHIDQSNARRQRLQRLLGTPLEFEPRRREDVDAVFIAAQPRQAQGLKPQLEFHHAADLPVYASSHAWTGELDARQLADMRGMYVPDIPWLLDLGNDPELARAALRGHFDDVDGPFPRLYAMGIDAFRLIPHLRRLASDTGEALDGSTGNLFMDDDRQVHRQLVWVRLDSPVEVIGFSPRLDLLPPMPQAGDTPSALPDGQPLLPGAPQPPPAGT